VIVTIEDHPFAGRTREELRSGFRSLAATPHVVFYRVKNNLPEIIRILDSRRDIEEIFAD
jgi:toxin ParE1/3/4